MLYVGIDLGTSAVKLLLMDGEGKGRSVFEWVVTPFFTQKAPRHIAWRFHLTLVFDCGMLNAAKGFALLTLCRFSDHDLHHRDRFFLPRSSRSASHRRQQRQHSVSQKAASASGLTSFLIQDLGVALRRGTVSRAFLSYHNHLPAATFFHASIIPSWSFTSSIRRAT